MATSATPKRGPNQIAVQEYDGSTPLKNIMQEMFVSNLLQGMNQSEAYRQAGYKAKDPANGSIILQRNSKVLARLAFKRGQLAQKLEITEERNLRAMANTAYVDLADFYNEDGSLKNIHDIPKEARMAMAGIEVEEIFEGRGENRRKVGETKKVRCWDRNKAQENIARILGQFKEDNEQLRQQTVIVFQNSRGESILSNEPGKKQLTDGTGTPPDQV